MSIKGLTDRNLSFPEIGQIRKGAKKTENAPGKDLTYFRVEFDEKEEETKRVFLDKYGQQPAEINILLPFNEIWRCWDAWLEAYTAGRMVARSDGEKYLYLVDVKTGQLVVKDGDPYTPYVDGKPVGYWINSKTKKQEPIICKPVGRLKVVIPELKRMAYLTVMTTSKHDIANLSAQLEGLKAINGGRIAGIPLVLRRRPKKISVPKQDGSKARYTKYMLSIEADPQWVKLMLAQVKQAALPGNGLKLLGESEPEAEDENEITGAYENDDEWEPEIDQDEDDDFPPDEETEPEPEQKQKQNVNYEVINTTFTDDQLAKDYGYGMPLSTAITVGGTEGLYVSMPDNDLNNRILGLTKAIPGYEGDKLENAKFKLAAIQTILAARREQSALA